MMPLYDFQCDSGHTVEKFFPVAKLPRTVACRCGGVAQHVILTAPALHTCATFSASIDDQAVQRTRDPGDGSYFDPNLFDRKTGKHPRIKSAKHREQVMRELGVQEIPPSDRAKDVARDKRRQAKTFSGVGRRS